MYTKKSLLDVQILVNIFRRKIVQFINQVHSPFYQNLISLRAYLNIKTNSTRFLGDFTDYFSWVL